MATNKKSFIAYCDWLELFDELEDDEAGKLIKHLLKYVNDLNPEAPDKLTKMAFIPIKQTLKRDLEKYQGIRERNTENGKKGGRPKKPTGLSGFQEKPKKADSDSDNDSDIAKGIDIRKLESATRVKSFESKYPIEMLREFYLYWSEHSDNGKKMRYEMQKVFNIERRLITWSKNQQKFETPKQQGYTDERTENILRQIANIPKS